MTASLTPKAPEAPTTTLSIHHGMNSQCIDSPPDCLNRTRKDTAGHNVRAAPMPQTFSACTMHVLAPAHVSTIHEMLRSVLLRW